MRSVAWEKVMTKTMMVAGLTVLCAVPSVFAQQPRSIHELKASPSTTHIFFFDASLAPVLRIESGDVVRLETATGNPRWFENAGVPRAQIPPELYAVYEGYNSTNRGDHTLNGPIFVNGAERGDVLEVRILSVDVRLSIAGQGIDRETAILLCSVAMDMVVTQVVDGTKGIHALVAKAVFRD